MSRSTPYLAVAFYKYVPIEEAEVFGVKHLKYCQRLGIFGRIIVADEGLNGQLSGTVAQCEQYMADLVADERFKTTDFKVDETDRLAFSKIHVRYKPEIVHSGLKGIDPANKTGIHLSAAEFKELKKKENVVVVDMRSNYEHHVGHFKDAITIDIENFRDLPERMNELEAFKDKTVITYCTGGIKCEKASAYLLENGFKDVYQLDGGILKYAKEGGGEDFEGKCYVFDGRVIVDVNTVNPILVSHCVHCSTPSARMINCVNELCNNQIVMCDACGWEWNGACSTECKEVATRAYDGTGYYTKSSQQSTVNSRQ